VNEAAAFAVVIPMFNEEAGAAKCVRRVCAELERVTGRNILIVVEDGSSDRTRAILERLTETEPKFLLICHPANQGYGAALRTGARRASELSFPYVLFMDSDLTNSPADIGRFAEEMKAGYDLIKADRYGPGGSVSGVPGYRVWISRIGNALARTLFRLPIHDCTNGFRAIRTDLLMAMRLEDNRFPVIMEELHWCRLLARRYKEIPVTLTNRENDQRSTSFTYRPSVFWRYLQHPLRAALGIRPSGWKKI